MRYLAIDPGDKRTGLAIGDDQTRIVSPLQVIETSSPDERLRLISRVIADEQPDAIVVGLPLNMDGSEGEPAKRSRALAQTLSARLGLPAHLMDERLTSAAADAQLAGQGLTRDQKKARRDALAAAEILRDFLGREDA